MRIIQPAATVVVVCLLLTGCSTGDGENAATDTPTPTPASTSPTASLPTELLGSWAGRPGTIGTRRASVTFTDCAIGERCGRLRRIDENAEHCVYTLVYRKEHADSFIFSTGQGNTFGCSYSPWSEGRVTVTPGQGDTIDVDNGVESLTLKRVEQ